MLKQTAKQRQVSIGELIREACINHLEDLRETSNK
jgi:hypothetical protein